MTRIPTLLGIIIIASGFDGILRAQEPATQPMERASENPLSLAPEPPPPRPVDGIRDNAFFVEEAYNQEAGVVQHVIFANFGVDERGTPRTRSWDLNFSQEWPIFSQRHQFSYAIPYSFVDVSGEPHHDSDIGDIQLDYRYQVSLDEGSSAAIAPRISLILPTGDEDRDFGNGVVGYQFNLPISKTITDRLYINFNAGFTHLPNVQRRQADGRDTPEYDLLDLKLGASAIYSVTEEFNLMLEATWTAGQDIDEHASPLDKRIMLDRRHVHEVVISPGMRWAINLPENLQIVPGLAFPIGLTSDSVDYGIFFYLSIEHSFLGDGK